MWQKHYAKTFKGLQKESIWQIWSDINNWPKWNPGIKSCELQGQFQTGAQFKLTPLSGPPTMIDLIYVEPLRAFTDCTRFFGAKMYGHHEIETSHDSVTLKTSISITGPLGWIWRKLVAEKIAAKLEAQTDALVQLASHA